MLTTKLLIIEDDPIFTNALMWQITRMGYDRMYIQSSASIAELNELATLFIPEVILLDLNITDSQGMDTYNSVISIFPNAAVIILSGMSDEELALEIVKCGAQDYLLKSDVNSKMLGKAIEYSKERKNLLGLLKVSEFKYRNVFNQSPLPMFIVSGPELVISQVNKSFLDFYLYAEAEVIQKPLQFLSKLKKPESLQIHSAFKKTDVHLNSEGKELHVDIMGRPIEVGSDEFICLVIDHTAEWEFERKKYKVISDAQEKEKRKIAMDLHDGLSQTLALLNIWFNNLEIPEAQKNLKELFERHLDSAIKETRGIAYNLFPPDLEEGFIPAMNMLTERINRLGSHKISLEIQKGIVESNFDSTDKFNLYRIVQEFINNSNKHSESALVKIKIHKTSDGIHVFIDDNGKGFDMSQHSGGLGVKSIEHRIKLGSLHGGLKSAIGEGTQLDLVID